MGKKPALDSGLARALLAAIKKYDIPLAEGNPPENGVFRDAELKMLYSSGTAVLSQDKDGLLNFYNPAAATVFGYDIEEALDMPSVKLVPEHLRGERSKEFQKILEEKVKLEFNTIRLTKKGELIMVHAHVFPYELETGVFSIAAAVEIKE